MGTSRSPVRGSGADLRTSDAAVETTIFGAESGGISRRLGGHCGRARCNGKVGFNGRVQAARTLSASGPLVRQVTKVTTAASAVDNLKIPLSIAKVEYFMTSVT